MISGSKSPPWVAASRQTISSGGIPSARSFPRRRAPAVERRLNDDVAHGGMLSPGRGLVVKEVNSMHGEAANQGIKWCCIARSPGPGDALGLRKRKRSGSPERKLKLTAIDLKTDRGLFFLWHSTGISRRERSCSRWR